MVQNVDQVVAQGMDAATLQPWDPESNKPGVLAALDKGIIMTSFFSPLADTGIPTARSDEKGVRLRWAPRWPRSGRPPSPTSRS